MDILVLSLAVILFVGSVVGSIVGNMISNELYDRAPLLARWLIERAVRQLPVRC